MSSDQGQTEMRSVLFTDLVGSTKLRVRLGEVAADELRRVHDRMLAEIVVAHGGSVVKGLGDGVMASFLSSADAASAAVAVQQAAELHSRRYPEQAFVVRVGVSVGDVSLEGGDIFGVPVVEASRLCEAANGNEILVAEAVRTLSRGRGGFQFEPYGSLELRGLTEPLATCRLFWEPAEDVAEGAEPSLRFPPLLSANTPYVGRPQLLGQLQETFATTSRSGCRMTLLAGEPGVGKTRTAAELAHHAHSAGAVVLFGRCDEDLGAPYQPFMEALDFYTQETAEPVLGRLSGELVRLLPQLAARCPDLGRPISSDPRSEEHLLFEATASWLVELASSIPVVLVLDDLHWADKPTLVLLLHVLRAATASGEGCRLFVVGTYRDTDIDRSHPLAGTLADLRRLPVVERHPVSGLNEAEVAQFIAAAAGHDLDEETRVLADAVYAETEGNPFFVAEVLRHLVETEAVVRRGGRWVVADPGTLSVPEGVRDVIGRRLSRLSDGANELLSVAAVIGRDIDVELLADLSDLTESTLLDVLDEALRARIIDETGADHYRFSHALIKATLYEELSATRRRRLHRRVAEVLEKLHPEDVVALAYHYVEAGPEGGLLTRAIRYSLAAAEQSLAARALADAERRFRQVLEVLEEADLDDGRPQLAAQCGLGECQRDQGNPAFRDTLLAAACQARGAGDTEMFFRAVLSNSRGFSLIGVLDPERVELTRSALDVVGPEPSPVRARLLSLLASDLVFEHEYLDEACRLAEEAEAIARGLDDPVLLARVLVDTAFAMVSLDGVGEQLSRGEEATRLADATGDPALRALARYHWSATLLMAADMPRSRKVLNEGVTIAAEASPSVQWMMQTTAIRHLLLDGLMAEALIRNDECMAMGQDLGEQDVASWWAAVVVNIGWQRDDIAWMAEQCKAFADHFLGTLVWRSCEVVVLALAGRNEDARAVLRDYDITPNKVNQEKFPACGPVQLALTALHLKDADLAEAVARTVRPYRGLWSHFYLAAFAPVSGALANCEWAMGHLDAAVELFEETLSQLEKASAVGLLPQFYAYCGELLLQRGAPGDAERAKDVLGRAREGAAFIDAPNISRKCDKLAAKLPF
ncbi:MAG TPA: AAA family ATPase [Acidimicrobiales bacterium]|nr:AAA family ATPase [Acidimicrobiales bacterium]